MLKELPARESTRLKAFNYIGQKSYFVTICCFRRKTIFLNAELSHWLSGLLRSESVARSFNVHAYCVMPDHLHFLAEGFEATSDLRLLVKGFKIKSSRQYAALTGGILWQMRYYDHILRSPESLQSVATYIWMNPVRKGFVLRPADYPFVGSYTGKSMPVEWNDSVWCPPWKKIPRSNS